MNMKITMSRLFVLSVLLVSVTSLVTATLDRKSFFKSISTEDQNTLKTEREKLSKLSDSDDKRAFLATIIMKESQFMPTVKGKWDKFTLGKNALEKEIKANPNNAEYRFLRLLIQENAPKIVRYSSNVSQDAQFIAKNLSTINAVTKKTIQDYAKKSPALTKAGVK